MSLNELRKPGADCKAAWSLGGRVAIRFCRGLGDGEGVGRRDGGDHPQLAQLCGLC